MIALLGQAIDEAPRSIDSPEVAWVALAPILVLVGGALVLLVLSSLSARRGTVRAYAPVTVLSALAAIAAAMPLWDRVHDLGRGPFSTVGGALGVDGFSVFATFAICAGVALSALLLDGFLRRERLEGVEPYALLLLSASGGLIMASANDLIVMFLGLEVLSLAAYVLAAMHLRRATSQESGVKYFVLGAFASAFFLYGVALVYGGTGSTSLLDIAELFSTTVLRQDGLVLAGIGLMLVGLAFKVAAVPFHFWTPDVYQGAPTPSVAYLASGVKVAGFAGMLRILFLGFDAYRVDWQPILYALAVATLLTGAVLAVVQTDVKRMLAYSSINHAGFVLVAVQAANDQGVDAAMFYLAAYTFMVAGSFGVVAVVGRRGDIGHGLDDYRGLSPRRAWPGCRPGAVAARPGGCSADIRLLRQVLRSDRGGRRRVDPAGAGGHGLRGHIGVRLPADHRVDVHVRRRRWRSGRRARRWRLAARPAGGAGWRSLGARCFGPGHDRRRGMAGRHLEPGRRRRPSPGAAPRCTRRGGRRQHGRGLSHAVRRCHGPQRAANGPQIGPHRPSWCLARPFTRVHRRCLTCCATTSRWASSG